MPVGERYRAGEALVFAQHALAAAISLAGEIGGSAVPPAPPARVRAALALAFAVLALTDRVIGLFDEALAP